MNSYMAGSVIGRTEKGVQEPHLTVMLLYPCGAERRTQPPLFWAWAPHSQACYSSPSLMGLVRQLLVAFCFVGYDYFFLISLL